MDRTIIAPRLCEIQAVCLYTDFRQLTNQGQMITLKKLFLMLFFLSVIPLTSFGQFSLTIEFDGLRNSNGQILFEFMNENGIKITGIAKKIEDKKCIIVIENLKPGKYAFKYFHDENNNEKLDLNWVRIPKEGYGFSNNAKGSFGPPSFEKTIFVLEENTTLKCTPAYLKF
jgi:uncharacterized protein (DUF2141 family)